MNPLITSLLVFVGLTVFVYVMYGRVSVLLAMKPENRLDHPGERTRALVRFGLGQKRMVDREERGPGTAHVLIFVAFVVLILRTLMLFSMGFSESLLGVLSTPTDPFWTAHPTVAAVFDVYLLAKDLAALGALVGVAYFFWLRLDVKPDRMTRSWEAYLILGLIAGSSPFEPGARWACATCSWCAQIQCLRSWFTPLWVRGFPVMYVGQWV